LEAVKKKRFKLKEDTKDNYGVNLKKGTEYELIEKKEKTVLVHVRGENVVIELPVELFEEIEK